MGTPSDSDVAEPKVVRRSLAYQKDLFSLIQSVATVLALIAGAVWFLLQGQPFVKANTTLLIEDRRLPGTDWTILIVTFKVENVGMRKIEFTQGVFRAAPLVPVPQEVRAKLSQIADEASSPEVSKLGWTQVTRSAANLPIFVNAGETEHVTAEFLVPSAWSVVRIYAKLSTNKDSDYWSMTALHDIQPRKTEDGHEITSNAVRSFHNRCNQRSVCSPDFGAATDTKHR